MEENMIKLERFNLSDENAYLKIAQDISIEKFFRLAYCENLEEAQDLMELCVNSCNYDAFKILDEQNQIIGLVLGEKKPKKVMEVSYFISAKVRRKGYCKEAICQFAKYISENTKYKELEFCIRHANKPSKKFMEKKLKVQPVYMTKDFIHYKKKVSEF